MVIGLLYRSNDHNWYMRFNTSQEEDVNDDRYVGQGCNCSRNEFNIGQPETSLKLIEIKFNTF